MGDIELVFFYRSSLIQGFRWSSYGFTCIVVYIDGEVCRDLSDDIYIPTKVNRWEI